MKNQSGGGHSSLIPCHSYLSFDYPLFPPKPLKFSLKIRHRFILIDRQDVLIIPFRRGLRPVEGACKNSFPVEDGEAVVHHPFLFPPEHLYRYPLMDQSVDLGSLDFCLFGIRHNSHLDASLFCFDQGLGHIEGGDFMNRKVKGRGGGLHFLEDAFFDAHPWRKECFDLCGRWRCLGGYLEKPQ